MRQATWQAYLFLAHTRSRGGDAVRVLRILPLKTAWNARDLSVIAKVLQVLQSLVERDVPTGARAGRRSLVGGGARVATGPSRRPRRLQAVAV